MHDEESLVHQAQQNVEHKKKPGIYRFISWKYRWILPALLLLLLLITCGVVIGANDSMPGEPLYSVKKTMEKIRLKLTPSDVDKACLHVQFAERRAKEIVEMSKSNKTQEMEILANRAKNELEHIVSIAERMKSKENEKNKVDKIIKELQQANKLNSGSGIFDEPLYPVKIAVEDTLLKLATSDVEQAGFHIEFARQRIQKIVELSQYNNSTKLDELFQGVEQHLVSLDLLIDSMASQENKESEVREIKAMLENAAAQNLNMFNEKLETATVQIRPALEQALERSQMYFNNELESLNQNVTAQ